MSDIVNEMIVAVRGDMSKPLNAVDRLRLYEAGVTELDPGDAEQLIEYLEEATDGIESLLSERQRTSDLIEEVKRVLGSSDELLKRVMHVHVAPDECTSYVADSQRWLMENGGTLACLADQFASVRALLSKLEER